MKSTELVPSASVVNLVNQRTAVIERLDQAVALIREASALANAGHVGMPRIFISTTFGRRGSNELQIAAGYTDVDRDGSAYETRANEADHVAKRIRLGVDCAAWQWLMHQSGLRSLMDHAAREKWDAAIYEGDVPELTETNIRSTFEMLHAGRGEMFERGVIECFRGLSWNYKTNLPQKFGRRIVLTYLRSEISDKASKWGSKSLGRANHQRCEVLDDISRVFHILDGKPEPDHRNGWYGRLNAVAKTTDPDAEDDYMRIRSFRNGNGHATFKRADLVERMNKIIAAHYPGALPQPK